MVLQGKSFNHDPMTLRFWYRGDIVEIQTKACPGCREIERFEVPLEHFKAWRAGQLIHSALSSLTDAQCERLVSGYCDKCWQGVFNNTEDDINEDLCD